jgi:hypothetical protein
MRAWIALAVGSAIRTGTQGRKLRGNGIFRVQKDQFVWVTAFLLIMHTCVLILAFPFWWPNFMQLFDVCVYLKASRKMRRQRLVFHHFVFMIKLMESEIDIGDKILLRVCIPTNLLQIDI